MSDPLGEAERRAWNERQLTKPQSELVNRMAPNRLYLIVALPGGGLSIFDPEAAVVALKEWRYPDE